MKRVSSFCFFLCLAANLFGQATSLNGTVTDPTGAVIPNATLTLAQAETSNVRETTSDSSGRYSYNQVQPGTWKLTAKAAGFNDVTINEVRLQVNQPATINVAFEKIGSTTTTVQVEAETIQVNTTDASLGNAIGGKVINQLPFEGRNVVGLLSLQPGVVYLGEPDPGSVNDNRSGAVNGGKSDQANVTLDGVDVNDQQNRAAFNSVLRVTLDSVQEFRTTTTGAGADLGRSSGAQVTLITKAGTNTVHGSAYEYLRNTATSATDFFSNSAGVKKAKLNRNVFGASLGGPIKHDRLFFFMNYEGRRDASEATGLRIVPTDNIRQGIFRYQKTDNSIGTLNADQIKAQDPARIGINKAILDMYNLYPRSNDSTVGDGLNTSGFRFNASAPVKFATYIAKFDYMIDTNGKHSIFWRGNLQNDSVTAASCIPQFPGQGPKCKYLENSKGYATGYTALLKANLVSTFRYGLTRQGAEQTGSQQAAAAVIRDVDTLYPQGASARGLARIIPVQTFTEDLTWTKGAHTVAFGGVFRNIDNNRASSQNSFSRAFISSSWLDGTGSQFLVADAKNTNPYKRQFNNILGIESQLDHQINYDLQGNILPEGSIIKRKFNAKEYEMYVADTWKVTRNLSLNLGVRYSLSPPIKEVNGYQTSSNIPLGDFLEQRRVLADKGQSQALTGPLTFDLYSKTGIGLYPFHKKNFGPRIGLAYAPRADNGIMKMLFGGTGKSSIRAGFGVYYDIFGQGIARDSDSTALGFSSLLTNPGTASAITSPRFTGFYSVPLDQFIPAPKGGFPQTFPNSFAITNGIDPKLGIPKSYNVNFSISREFKGGFLVEGSYVGRFARNSLIGEDVAMPTDLKDPVSGQTYNQAGALLGNLVFANTPVANVPKIPFFENLYPAGATATLTATQTIYNVYKGTGGDFTSGLTNIDGVAGCKPCSKLGPNAIFNAQYGTLSALRSIGYGDYNGMQWTIRKRFSQGYQFDLNYTFSKSIDLASTRESNPLGGGGGGGGQIINSWAPDQMRGVSDYDTQHVISALFAAELPFGKGKAFLSNANALVEGVLGGWQLSGVFRNTSGFPVSAASGGVWPTSWAYSGNATQIGVVPNPTQTKNAPAATPGAKGGPNVFANPQGAFNAYQFSTVGQSGQRNGIRGDGYFGTDMGLNKRFKVVSIKDHNVNLSVRGEGFNVFNSVRFDVGNQFNLSVGNQAKFGQYTQLLTKPRVFQFSARLDF